ncbi:MAG: tetratricopeptide repeat protein [Trueperaceae bacterium]
MNARREPRYRSGVKRLLATAWIVCSFLTAVQAQALPLAAADALEQAQSSAAAALIEYSRHSPDRPLWAEALRLGRAAAAAAPDHPAPQRFLAQAYQQVGFYARAWDAWEAYRTFGGTLDVVAERHVIEVARWMGVATYDRGRRTDAIPYFVALLELAPFDAIANERLARTFLEQGEPLRARPYLEALDGSIPDLDDDLEFVRQLDEYGEEALRAFEAGVAAARAGDPTTALVHYTDATRAAPGFIDAWRAVIDAALVLGRDGVAAQAIDQLLILAPDDPRGLSARAALARAESARIAETEAAQAQATAEAAARAAAQAEAARSATERQAAEAAAAAAAEEAARSAAAAAAERATQEATESADDTAAAEAAAADERAALAEADRIAAEEEAARVAAREEAERVAAEREAARVAAEAEAARVAAAEEAARAATARSAELAATATLTLGDVGHTHVAGNATANPSIAYVASPGLRVDLSTHVDDVLHVRATVTERAGDAPMWLQFCLVPPDVAVAPACSATDLLVLGSPGTYEASVRWSGLAGASSVDWRNGVDALMWVLRRPDGTPVSGSGADADRYLPTSLRVRVIAAPTGATSPDGR